MKIAKKSLVFKTFSPKQEELKAEWLLVDVKGKTLGRVANKIADLLRGKGKTTFSKHVIAGDYVIVINAAEVKLTGKKETDKDYNWHTRFPGGLKTLSPQDMRAKHPERLVEYAVAGMLPHNKLKKQFLKRLKVFSGAEHDMSAQNPRIIEL
jgi:large subunit ribosomal protein L13